jgi:hypothetical protein
MTVNAGAARDAAYARLRAAEALGGTLVKERRPAQMRATLDAILATTKQTVDEMGDRGDPYLMSHTYLTRGAADVDRAILEAEAPARDRDFAQGADDLDAGVSAATESDSAALALKIVPWAMVVLSSALQHASGRSRRAFEVRMELCIRDLQEACDRQQRDVREGAKTLFASQMLLEGARSIADPSARRVVLGRARELASEARTALLKAGAYDIAEQAAATFASIPPPEAARQTAAPTGPAA